MWKLFHRQSNQVIQCFQIVGFLLLIVFYLGIPRILDPNIYLGKNTRDIFDHIALLDHWYTKVQDWNFPEGGILIPPDLSSMLIASPFFMLGLPRGLVYDVTIVMQMWLNCIAGWYLGKTLKISPFFMGCAIGFSPYILGQINSGEMETIAMWPFLITLTCLHRNSWKMAGFWSFVTAVFSWYYGSYMALILGCHVGILLWRQQKWQAIWSLGIFGLLIAPLAIWYQQTLESNTQMFRGPNMQTYLTEHPRALAAFCADPTVWFGEIPQDANHIDFLGWLGLLFIITHILQNRSQRKTWWYSNRFWIMLLFFSLAFSLGPTLHIKQHGIWEWMPYDILLQMPFLDLMRLPHRWMLVASIAFAVLIGKSIEKFPHFATLMILGEAWLFIPPIQSTIIETPQIIEKYSGVVLELPTRTLSTSHEDARGHYLVWSRIHQQTIPYSLLMQGWSQGIATEPLVIAVTSLDSRDMISNRSVEARQFRQEEFALQVAAWNGDLQQLQNSRMRLKELGMTQVCLHLSLLNSSDIKEITQLLENALGQPDIETGEAWLWNL